MRLLIGVLCTVSACGRIGFDRVPDDGTLTDTSGSGRWASTNVTGAPVGRYWHTGVWTGTELIVFGGTTANGGNHVNTGGRYAPATDSWVATTTTNAPTTRSWHSAVWTGSEMIVWGGRGPNNTGGRYDPMSDSWVATATTGAPSARWSHSAVWTGTRMIVWGGYGTGTLFFDSGGQYDPIGNAWSATSTTGAPSPRTNQVAVWTGAKMIVWGGCSGADSSCTSGSYPQDGGVYDPSSDTWAGVTATGAPVGRSGARAFWLPSISRMLIWGGQLADGSATDTGGLYDPATDSWTPTSTAGAPVARRSFSAAWTGSRLLVWGGYGAPASSTGDIYDPATDTWTPMDVTGAPSGRGEPLGPSTVWTGSEMIVWGGDGPNSGENTGGVFVP